MGSCVTFSSVVHFGIFHDYYDPRGFGAFSKIRSSHSSPIDYCVMNNNVRLLTSCNIPAQSQFHGQSRLPNRLFAGGHKHLSEYKYRSSCLRKRLQFTFTSTNFRRRIHPNTLLRTTTPTFQDAAPHISTLNLSQLRHKMPLYPANLHLRAQALSQESQDHPCSPLQTLHAQSSLRKYWRNQGGVRPKNMPKMSI